MQSTSLGNQLVMPPLLLVWLLKVRLMCLLLLLLLLLLVLLLVCLVLRTTSSTCRLMLPVAIMSTTLPGQQVWVRDMVCAWIKLGGLVVL
jgi:hypothetical protein